MPQYELNLWDYLRVLRKRKWVMLLAFLVVFGSTLVYTHLQPPVYRAGATVRYSRESIALKDLLGIQRKYRLVMADPMITEMQVARSQAVIEKVVKKLELINSGATAKEVSQVVASIRACVSTQVVEKTDLIQIYTAHPDPELAARIANATAEAYKEVNLEEKTRESRNLKTFLKKRLGEISRELHEAEEKLKEFQETEGVTKSALPVYEHLAELEQQHQNLLANPEKHPEIMNLNQKIEVLKEQREGLLLYPERQAQVVKLDRCLEVLREERNRLLSYPQEHPKVVKSDQRVEALREKRSALLMKYTEQHPEVIRLDEQIELLNKEREALLSWVKESPEVISLNQQIDGLEQERKYLLAHPEEFPEVNRLNKRIGVLEEEHQARLKEFINQWHPEIIKLDREINTLRKEQTQVLSNSEKVAGRINEVNQEIESLTQEHDSLIAEQLGEEPEIIKLDTQIAGLKEERTRFLSEPKAFAEKIKVWDEAITSLEQKRVLLSIKLLSSNPELIKLNQQLTGLKKEGRELLAESEKYVVLIKELDSKLASLTQERESRLKEYTEKDIETDFIKKLDQEIASLKKQLSKYPAQELELVRLTREVKITTGLYEELKEKYTSTEIEAEQVSDITLVNSASVPKTPFRPKKPMNRLIGIIIGVLLALVVGFVVEHLDTSIGTIEEIENLMKTPVLALIPHIGLLKKKTFFRKRLFSIIKKQERKTTDFFRQAFLITQFEPKSPIAESYKTLRTNIIAKKGETKTLLFTSAVVEEGKTLTTVNCAIAMAQAGLRTLLLDADLRKPTIHKVFGLEKEPGLTDFLLGQVDYESAVKSITEILFGDLKTESLLKERGIENLSIITAGRSSRNPAELLNSEQMILLMEEIKNKFDIILIDSPPVIPVADASIMASKSDRIILVHLAGGIARGVLHRIKVQLETVQGNLLGVVLNDIKSIDMAPGMPYHYYHSRYYGKYYRPEKEETEA